MNKNVSAKEGYKRATEFLGAVFLGAVALACLMYLPDARADEGLSQQIDASVSAITARLIETRRHIHQHPELGNREIETAAYVATRLKSLGYEVHTGIAVTGVVGVMRFARAGRAVALRSELDALPVAEQVNVPFKSTVRTLYDGSDVGVMHACGHDAHMAILLGVAEVLAGLRDSLSGSVELIFQPSEEGAPTGETGGAARMIKEGVLNIEPKPNAIFGLHVFSQFDVGTVATRARGLMAGSDDFKIIVKGRQTHGAQPWNGVDPIVIASQIILGLQTIPSRQLDITRAPVVITVGKISGGVKSNIIPDSVELIGTVRALESDMLTDALVRVERTAKDIAASAGGSVDFSVDPNLHYKVTFNDPALTQQMQPTLQRVAGLGHVLDAIPVTGGEDFAEYQQRIPGLFVFIGGRTSGAQAADFPPNHSPRFQIDEAALGFGVRTLTNLSVDYLMAR